MGHSLVRTKCVTRIQYSHLHRCDYVLFCCLGRALEDKDHFIGRARNANLSRNGPEVAKVARDVPRLLAIVRDFQQFCVAIVNFDNLEGT